MVYNSETIPEPSSRKCLQYVTRAGWYWLHKLGCSRIRSVLKRTGLDQTWESQIIGNANKFMLSFIESIVRIFTQRWRQDIESSSKLRICAFLLCNAMNNECEILLYSVAAIIKMQPINTMFLGITTYRDITVVKSLVLCDWHI